MNNKFWRGGVGFGGKESGWGRGGLREEGKEGNVQVFLSLCMCQCACFYSCTEGAFSFRILMKSP
jgi:hypothetical protein